MIRCLCAGESRAKERGVFGGLGQFGVGHGFHLPAQQHALGRQAHFLADLAADQFVVAGENLHRDAVLLQRQDGRRRGLLGRIEEGHVALEDQVVLVVLRVGRLGARRPCRRSPARGTRRRSARRTPPSSSAISSGSIG